MAGETAILYTPGSGGKAHGYQRTIGGNALDESVVIDGEAYLPSYVAMASAVSFATANDHIFALNAGSSLNVRIRRIHVEQYANSTSATVATIELWRLSTSGTGGTSVTPAPFDLGDNPAGATAMSLPSSKGTELTLLWRPALPLRSTGATTGGANTIWEWTPTRGMKPLLIPAGTTNGFAVKQLSAIPGATGTVWIEFTESAWL